jgi:hypothetical protein
MSYEDERYGDRGIMRGEVDYDEFDELAGMDLDYLQEIGAVMAPTTAIAPTTSRCPSGEEYDKIEQMCRPVQTSTGTTITRLRAQLQTTAPSTLVATAPPPPTTSRCPTGEEWDKIEQMCRKVAPTRTFDALRLATATAPTATVLAPVKPRDTPVISSTHPAPPDAVRAADVLVKAPAPPSLPSYSSPFKGGRASAPSAGPAYRAPAPVELLTMPDAPPPSTGKVVGLSTTAKVAIGVGAGALLLYVMTRK